jgi:hypothetical protein
MAVKHAEKVLLRVAMEAGVDGIRVLVGFIRGVWIEAALGHICVAYGVTRHRQSDGEGALGGGEPLLVLLSSEGPGGGEVVAPKGVWALGWVG